MARLPGHGRGLGRSPWKWQVPGPQQRHREHAGEWGLEEEMGCRGEKLHTDTRPPPLQEWDRTYVHSFYHCALAMSFILLLPKVNTKAGGAGPPAKLDCGTLCCACI